MSFLVGEQWNPKSLALWMQEYDNPTFLKWGGSNTLFQPSPAYSVNTGGGVGQVQGPLERQQLLSLLPVQTYIVTHPSEAVAEEKKLGLGFQSPNDPNYFVPYWAPENDMKYVSSAIDAGDTFNSIVSGLKSYGYPDPSIADTICQICANYFQAVRGTGNYWQVASALGFPYNYQVTDPIFGINPYTDAQQQEIMKENPGDFTPSPQGTLSQTSPVWANHIGGETVNLCFPFNDVNTQKVASLIHTALLTYFDSQQGAILYGISNNYDDTIANALPDVATRMYQYCEQQGNGYSFGNMLSPTPFTPTQRQYLSQSQYYNPIQEHPPTFADSFAITILSGVSPWIQNGGSTVTYEKQTSYYGLDPNLFQPLVLKNWAHRLNLWMSKSKLPIIPEISLLKPFAALYDQ